MRYYSDGSTEELHVFTVGDLISSSPPIPPVKYDLNSGIITEIDKFPPGSGVATVDSNHPKITDFLQVSNNTLAFAITLNPGTSQTSLLALNNTTKIPIIGPIDAYTSGFGMCCMLLYKDELYVGYTDGSFTGIAVYSTSPPYARLREYRLSLAPYSMRIVDF